MIYNTLKLIKKLEKVVGGIDMLIRNLKQRKKGLTLVEILVVILIISILIVALVPRVTSALDKAKETQIRTDFRTFSTAVESVLRECAGFNGVPLVDHNGKTLATIGEKFWNKGDNVVVEDENTPVTQSLIKSVNRYLETNYQFGVTGENFSFGRSKATDPWGKQYEIYFVSRNADKSTGSECVTDKVYIVANGKTQHQFYPDYMMLCEYKNGEVRTAMAGFGDTLSTDYATYSGTVDKSDYTVLASLFDKDSFSHGLNTPIIGITVDNIGNGTLFNMKTDGNKERLFVETIIGNKSAKKASEFDAIEAIEAPKP